jgi:hypothetical protein
MNTAIVIILCVVYFLFLIFSMAIVKSVYCNKCPYKDECKDIMENDGVPPCKQNNYNLDDK